MVNSDQNPSRPEKPGALDSEEAVAEQLVKEAEAAGAVAAGG